MTKIETIEPILEATVPGVGEIFYVEGKFSEARDSLEKTGCKLASAQDIAKARIHLGVDHDISQYGSLTKEGFVFMPREHIFIRNHEKPLFALDCPLRQVVSSACVREYEIPIYPSGNLVRGLLNKLEEDAGKEFEKKRIMRLSTCDDYSIPTGEFEYNEFTRFIFKDTAKEYGSFLRKSGIKSVPVRLISMEITSRKYFSPCQIERLWFGGLFDKYNSAIDGKGKRANVSRVRGIRK